ncbi:MAG: carbamoyltransferase [Nitrospirae bacterium]|nr:carbamoyltransferase [Nitrospirota bacterium]
MNIIGISCFYHDSAAALIRNGEVIAAAQEERFTRKKHDPDFPKHAIEYCLKEGNIAIKEVDYVAFYDKPFIKFERIVETYLAYAPRGLRSFLMAVPLWLKDKLWMSKLIRDELGGYEGDIIFPEHHESHAASAFYPSPFEEAAFLTIDGVGEWTTTSFGIGRGNNIEMQYELQFPHSLGLLYSAFTYYTGFKVNSGEYKVMGLAPYGEPKYANLIYEHLVDIREDGSFKLNMKYFNYCAGLTMTNEKFHLLFGGSPRKPETLITQRDMDIAASLQEVTEEVMLRMARHVRKVTGQKYLCLAGGVALNCVANGKILRENIFDDLWIQPAAGDAGGALGAALFTWHQYLGNKRNTGNRDRQKGPYLGPAYSSECIEDFLVKKEIPFNKYELAELPEVVADLLMKGKVIGWFYGRMEFGPRAVGSRSIIGDARSPEMQSKMNLKIKFRESFRPFAPSVLSEKVSEWFEIDRESPYMLLTADVKREKQLPMSGKEEKLWGIDKLKVVRSEIPAVTHVDYSARIQTVNKEDNPMYYEIINKFYN